MYRAVGVALVMLGAAACTPSFEAEYQAAEKELSQVKLQLAEALNKLSAADHETRSKIFSLARRANTHLLAPNLDANLISTLQQEMSLLSESYSQLNKNQDITALSAQFYTDKLALVAELNRSRIHAYDRQYTACLSDLDSNGKKSELSTMLCEVQADAAARKPRQQYLATLAATMQIGKKLLDDRRTDTLLDAQQIERLFTTEVNNTQTQDSH